MARDRLFRALVAVPLAMSLMAVSSFLFAVPASAACIVDNGANNATDSGAEFGLQGYPGSDDGPFHDQGSWAPTNGWHDNWLKEWCEPSHDWVWDNYIRWEGTRWDRIQAYKDSRSIAQDINISGPEDYNHAGAASSNLPYTGIYVADVLEQWRQGYEEVSFLIPDVSRIAKGFNYYTRTQWDQEQADLGWIDSKSQWTDRWFNSIYYDQIGRMDAKKVLQ